MNIVNRFVKPFDVLVRAFNALTAAFSIAQTYGIVMASTAQTGQH